MLNRRELETRLLAMTPALDGLTTQDGVAVLLTMLDGIAETSGEARQMWSYVLLMAQARLERLDDGGNADCWGGRA